MCLYPVFCCHGNNIVSGKQKALITAILGESKYWTFRKEECTDPKGLRAVSGTRQASLTARSQQRQAMPALLPYSAHRLEPKRWEPEMFIAWISCFGWEKLNCSLIEVEFSITFILHLVPCYSTLPAHGPDGWCVSPIPAVYHSIQAVMDNCGFIFLSCTNIQFLTGLDLDLYWRRHCYYLQKHHIFSTS